MKKATAKKQNIDDNKLLVRAWTLGKVRYERWDDGRGEICIGGIRYCVNINDGIPLLNENIRSALQKQLAQEQP